MRSIHRCAWAAALVCALAACKSIMIRPDPTALSGPLCTAQAGGGTHCDQPPSCEPNDDGTSRCAMFHLHTLTDPHGWLGTTYYYAWWVRPKNRTQGEMAARVPVMFAHGMGMNDGWAKGLRVAQRLADQTGRPFIYVAELTLGGWTSQTMTLKGSGDLTGRRVDDIALAGANTASYTWEGAWIGPDLGAAQPAWFGWWCPQGGRVYLSTSNQYRCMNCSGWFADSSYLTGLEAPRPVRQPACYKQVRAGGVYVGSAPWAFQKARAAIVASGYLSPSAKIDVVAHSAGAAYIAAAIANHNGRAAGPTSSDYTGFYASVRNVITAHGVHLGVIDGAVADGEAFRSRDPWGSFPASRPTFINAWRTSSRFSGVRWYALRSASCARENPWQASGDAMLRNYAFGQASNRELGWIRDFCGSSAHRGDKVVPTVAQSSPWPNSYGWAETTCGRTTYTFREIEHDCNHTVAVRTAAGTTWSTTGGWGANWSGEANHWRGDHRWLVSTPEGLAHVLETMEIACLNSGGSCRYEEPCYTGPPGTAGVGQCRVGHRYTYDPAGVCHGQVLPSAETCDRIDNDCNGAIDDHQGRYAYVDADHDGYGAGGLQWLPGCAHLAYSGQSDDPRDCHDGDARVRPDQPSTYQWIGISMPDGSVGWDFTCDGIPEPHCGDGTCQPEEDWGTCEVDCGPPPTCSAGYCGGWAPAGCACDAYCTSRGDCCEDACWVCDACGDPNECVTGPKGIACEAV